MSFDNKESIRADYEQGLVVFKQFKAYNKAIMKR